MSDSPDVSSSPCGPTYTACDGRDDNVRLIPTNAAVNELKRHGNPFWEI